MGMVSQLGTNQRQRIRKDTPLELLRIFEHFCEVSDYRLNTMATEPLRQILQFAYENRDKTFGNARMVRNLFEKAIANLANRIAALPSINEEALATIEADDLNDMGRRQDQDFTTP